MKNLEIYDVDGTALYATFTTDDGRKDYASIVHRSSHVILADRAVIEGGAVSLWEAIEIRSEGPGSPSVRVAQPGVAWNFSDAPGSRFLAVPLDDNSDAHPKSGVRWRMYSSGLVPDGTEVGVVKPSFDLRSDPIPVAPASEPGGDPGDIPVAPTTYARRLRMLSLYFLWSVDPDNQFVGEKIGELANVASARSCRDASELRRVMDERSASRRSESSGPVSADESLSDPWR